MIKSDELKAGVILSYAGMIANVVVNLVYTPVILRHLGKSEYGLYTLVASVVNYLSLCSLGFGASYLRFYSRLKVKKNEEELSNLNGMYLLLFLLFSSLAFILGMVIVFHSEQVLGNNLTATEMQLGKKLLFILTINISITMFTTVFQSMISAHECFIFQKAVMFVSVIVNPFLTFPALVMGYGSIALVLITTLISFLCLMINVWYCLVKLKIRFSFKKMQFSLLKEMGTFSFFLFLNAVIDQINWNVDAFLIGRYIGTVEVAVYGVASQINNLYMNLSTSVSGVFAPRVNKMVAENVSDEKLTDLFIKVGRVQFIILSLVASGFLFFGKYFITIWAGNDYGEAYFIALLLILPFTIALIQNMGIEIQRAKNKHQFRSLVYLAIAVLNIVISIPLIKLYGAIGAAIGTAVTLFLGTGVIMNWYYYRHLGINIPRFWKSIGKLGKSMIIPFIIGALLNRLVSIHSVGTFLGEIVIYVGVYVGCVFLFGLETNEKTQLILPIQKIGTRIRKHK